MTEKKFNRILKVIRSLVPLRTFENGQLVYSNESTSPKECYATLEDVARMFIENKKNEKTDRKMGWIMACIFLALFLITMIDWGLESKLELDPDAPVVLKKSLKETDYIVWSTDDAGQTTWHFADAKGKPTDQQVILDQ